MFPKIILLFFFHVTQLELKESLFLLKVGSRSKDESLVIIAFGCIMSLKRFQL